MIIETCPTPQDVSLAAAKLFSQTAHSAVEKHGNFAVALSGGSTPKLLFETLAQAPFKNEVPWEKIHVFWGDERWVPANDDRSNEKMTRQALLNQVPVPESQIHPMYHAKGSLEEACALYEKELKALGRPLDLVLLGLGDNGHTASLFPHTRVLEESEKAVDYFYLEEQSMSRMTLTASTINQASHILFLVCGESKASIVHSVLEGPKQPSEWPAQLIHPEKGQLTWLLDQAAAFRIHSKPSPVV
jgi:6-phosphogluconolactonase